MKKRVLIILLVVLALLLIFAFISVLSVGGFCDHEWLQRGCGYPDICTKCGNEMDFYIEEHLWADVECMEQEYCLYCNKPSDKEPGHTWIDATCSKAKYCEECLVTEGEPLEHQTEWVIDNPAGYFTAGQRTEVCTLCSETLNTESYHMDSYVENGYFTFTMDQMRAYLDYGLKKGEYGEAQIDASDENLAIISMTSYNAAIGAVMFYSNEERLTMDQTYECTIDKIQLYVREMTATQQVVASWYVVWLCAPPVGENEEAGTIYRELLHGFYDEVEESTDSDMPAYTVTHGAVTYSMTAEFDSDDALWYVITITPAE